MTLISVCLEYFQLWCVIKHNLGCAETDLYSQKVLRAINDIKVGKSLVFVVCSYQNANLKNMKSTPISSVINTVCSKWAFAMWVKVRFSTVYNYMHQANIWTAVFSHGHIYKQIFLANFNKSEVLKTSEISWMIWPGSKGHLRYFSASLNSCEGSCVMTCPA